MAGSRQIYHQLSSPFLLRGRTALFLPQKTSLASRGLLASNFFFNVSKRQGLTSAANPRWIQHPNPGNFANRSKEEMTEIGRKGGQKGGRAKGVGGFHDMDPAKQREIASKGGQASSGSFTKGSERAREAGRKGGRSRKRSVDEAYSDVFV